MAVELLNGAFASAVEIDEAGSAKSRAERLLAMATELVALARELDPVVTDNAGETPVQPAEARYWSQQARKAYRDRRLRAQIFGDDALFGEPAWDLLLDLYVAACEGKRTPVTSACIGAAVPNTTALRWLQVLEQRGLITREADPADARRVFVKLTDFAVQGMATWFASTLTKSGGTRRADDRPFMLGK